MYFYYYTIVLYFYYFILVSSSYSLFPQTCKAVLYADVINMTLQNDVQFAILVNTMNTWEV